MATYWENSCSFGLRYVSWYKCLIVSLVFSHLGFWSGNLFLIAPFPDLCLLVRFCYGRIGSSTCDMGGCTCTFTTGFSICDTGEKPVKQGPVLVIYKGCTGRIGTSTCDIGEVALGQSPVYMIYYMGCTGTAGSWSFDIGVVTVGQGPVLVIWGCTFYGGVQYL